MKNGFVVVAIVHRAGVTYLSCMALSRWPHLFSPYELGVLQLPHRIVMAPMTRSRSTQPGDVPNASNARYYAQRASAALIVTEATQISPQGKGYSFTPGLHDDAQVKGWSLATDAVHAEGGRIFAQLWHVGRMSHPSFHGGELPVAPSAVPFDGTIWLFDEAAGRGNMVPCPTPRALGREEIADIVDDYRAAARRAMQAGFDGVEIHGANGYLVDQFLRTTSNQRHDEYGGSRQNRLRFLREVVEAVTREVGADRTGLRLAPFLTQRGMACPDILPTWLEGARELDDGGLAYLHLVEADWDDAPQFTDEYRVALRRAFGGTIIVAGKYDAPKAEAVLAAGHADLVAFGRPFVANPDLPRRLREGLPLAALDPATLFGGGDQGYTSYPPADGVPQPTGADS